MSAETKNTGPASVQEIWEKTIVRFQQRTGQRLDGVSRTPDDLHRALDAHYAAQQDDSDTAKAKAIGFRMIHCIQLLGGIAAEGASMVFGPAGLCFNALSFLLDIPKKVNEFHGEINAIFAEVGSALAQFRIYQRMEDNTHVDEALRTAIDQVMTSFVDICANCINIHREGRWKSFKRSAKRVLLDEGSVRDELDNFKRLTQDQLNVQATLTLEVALETHQGVAFIKTSVTEIDTTTKGIKTDVTGLVEAEHKRGLDDARKKNMDSIKDKLGQKEEDVANVVDARDNMWKTSVKGSGKWLNNVDEYKQWLDRSSTADPFLILTGDPGTGKSFVVSAIAQDVKARNSTTKAERGLLGYYSFAIATKTDSDRHRPETAMKSICLQLADQDAVYAKHAAGVCGESGKDKNYFKDASCQTLWTTLGIGSPARNAMHYILLDAVGLLTPEELERLLDAIHQLSPTSEDKKSSTVRILLSSETTSFKEEWLASASAKSIDITEHNAEDISAFIVEELKKADLFQGQDSDSQRRRKNVEERLLKRSNNCYTTVQHDLGKIKAIVASSGTEDELNRVLQESSTDPKAQVRSELETLAAVLNPRELEEVNELLIWTVAGCGRFTLEELAAALYNRFKSVSLQPLAQKITGKYSKIFTLTYGGKFLTLRDHVKECVVAERVRPRQSVDDPKITATITITNGDIKAVQRFFWDLTHHSSFANGFEFRPDSDLSQATDRKIQIYEIDAHFEIVKKAFEFFLAPASEEKDKGKLSGMYLMACLPDHLKVLYEAEGLDELPLADKQYIGSHLYDLLNEGDLVESNWKYCGWSLWYRTDEEIDVFWKWLDDPVAIARLGSRDKRWLMEIKKGKHRNRRLLTPIATTVARNWLQREDCDVVEAFEWIRGLLALGTESEPPNTDSSEQHGTEVEAQLVEETEDDGEIFINTNDLPAEKVAKVETWAKEALGVSEVDYTWCIRLGQTYRAMWEKEAAIEQYQQAAIILQEQDPIDKERLASVFLTIGDLQSGPKEGLPYFTQAYEQNNTNVDILYALAICHAASGAAEDAASIIQKAAATTDPDTETSFLVGMLGKSVRTQQADDDIPALFAGFRWLTTSAPEHWTTLQTELEKAIDEARAEERNQDLATFQLVLGNALYRLRQEDTEAWPKAVDCWRAALATVHNIVGFEDQKDLVYIEQYTLKCLGNLRVEQVILQQNPNVESYMVELRQAYEDDRASRVAETQLVTLYVMNEDRPKARELLRADMVTAFNILVDDDAANDWEGFAKMRNILIHTGDFENAKRACMVSPPQWFDELVLEELLQTEDPPLEAASDQLCDFFAKECVPGESHDEWFTKVSAEVKRLLAAAEPESDEAAVWTRVSKIFEGYKHLGDHSFYCNWCGKEFLFYTGFNFCKYCHDMYLCDNCMGDLKGEESNMFYLCSKLHDWIPLEPWNTQSLVQAWKKLVPVVNEDGGEKLISASKWMGNLCEEWGLAKEDWDFE
ncbi:hypothetical protein BJY01DRAFT_229673 [Aspergillus pseudoustus]|uniref:Fungal STAND N-terminal Goodbye domain-containing protein n=1 Tax=Aspergillus pseudoustus TaxID=1810923 RepID=A0ABR4IFL1_9EURO